MIKNKIRATLVLSMILISACGGSGSGSSTIPSGNGGENTPPPVAKKYYAYSGAQYTNMIYGFKLDATTGAVSELPFVSIAAQQLPMILTASLDKRFLLAANYSSNSVSSYQIDQSTGALTLVENEALPASSAPAWIARHPTKPIYYTADSGTGKVSIIDSDVGGNLTVRSQIDAAAGVTCLVLNSNASLLYALNQNANSISIFAIDSSGDLTLSGTVATSGGAPNHMVLNSTGSFLYLANWNGQSVEGFKVDGTNLVSLGAPVASGANTYMVEVSPDGKFLFSSQPYGNTFQQFPLDATTGAIGAPVSFPLTGAVNFNFFKNFTLLTRWTSSATGLQIETRNYSDSTGIEASAVSSTTGAYQGFYRLTIIELNDI